MAVLALSSCGGGGDTNDGRYSPVVSDSLSKVEFLRQADQICHASESQIEAAADDIVTQKHPDPAEVEQVATGIVVPALESETAAIDALGAPEGDEDQIQAILDATREGIAQIEADPRGLADAGVPSGLKKAEKLSRSYGSQECGIR